jgi:Domain of unknown function (DUF4062)
MKVYVSATYADLIEYRAAVARVLRQMGHDVIGMEEYVAEGTRPLNRCLADAAGADICVIIVAWRYGYTPTKPQGGDTTWPSGAVPGQTSITECEFRAAVPKKPLVFVLDPVASWPAPFIDAVTGDNEGGVRIKRFRDEVLGNWLAGIFRTPEDLARQVSAAVYRREIQDRIGTIALALESGFAETLMSGGPVRDSTLHTMKHSLATAPQLAVLRVDLRNGQYWWSTRLFFLACVAEEIAATGLLIFLQDGKKFVGASTPATVRDRLARGDLLLRKFEENCRRNPVDPRNIDHALDQRATQWDTLFDKQAEEKKEEKTRILVSTRELRRWLGPDLLQRGVEQGRVSLAPAFLKNILDWPHPYVPVTSNGDLVMVINRAVFTEQLARMFVQDLERPSGAIIASPAVSKADLSETEQDPL